MLEDEGPVAPRECDDGHNRWLAMQSAYAEYMRASEALDCTYESEEGLAADERLRMMISEGRHRVAFEQYLEARMAFLEAHIDEVTQVRGSSGGASAALEGGGEDTGRHSWWSLASCRPFLEALAVVLLCTSAFSLVHVQKHMREIESARGELQTALTQTRDGLQALRQQVDALGPLQYSTTQRIVNTSSGVKPVRRAPSRMSPRKGSMDNRWKHQPTRRAAQKHADAKLYASAAAQTQRPALPRGNSPLSPSRQTTHERPRDAWGTPVGTSPGDSRF